MGAALWLEVAAAREAVASCRRDRRESLEVLRSLGSGQRFVHALREGFEIYGWPTVDFGSLSAVWLSGWLRLSPAARGGSVMVEGRLNGVASRLEWGRLKWVFWAEMGVQLFVVKREAYWEFGVELGIG